jgi:hypothetical protein
MALIQTFGMNMILYKVTFTKTEIEREDVGRELYKMKWFCVIICSDFTVSSLLVI